MLYNDKQLKKDKRDKELLERKIRYVIDMVVVLNERLDALEAREKNNWGLSVYTFKDY